MEIVEEERLARRRQPFTPSINPDAAGLDVGATFHVVAIPLWAGGTKPCARFGASQAISTALADWLKSVGVKTVAMESTGVYWIPTLREILEERGIEVLLVTARDARNVPGRKNDVNDAQWLQQLHEHGLLRGSFRPRDRCRPAPELCFGIASAWWSMPRRPTSSTCRRH